MVSLICQSPNHDIHFRGQGGLNQDQFPVKFLSFSSNKANRSNFSYPVFPLDYSNCCHCGHFWKERKPQISDNKTISDQGCNFMYLCLEVCPIEHSDSLLSSKHSQYQFVQDSKSTRKFNKGTFFWYFCSFEKSNHLCKCQW